jgi:hypothetical protein
VHRRDRNQLQLTEAGRQLDDQARAPDLGSDRDLGAIKALRAELGERELQAVEIRSLHGGTDVDPGGDLVTATQHPGERRFLGFR